MTDDRTPPTASSLAEANRVPLLRRLCWRRLLVLLLLLVIGIAAVCWAATFFSTRSPTPSAGTTSDPRLRYQGPFHNIHPDVAYVGDRACASCHSAISRSYSRHPMGRSLTSIADANESNRYDVAYHNPFTALGETFRIERRGQRVWHTQTRHDAGDRPVYTFETEVAYALGSGTRGRSYLSNRSGYLFQTAISWYAQKAIWDLSPGFNRASLSGRPLSGECLFCHANRARFHEDSLNRYEASPFEGLAIGCERCHGPGERHVRSSDPLDIVTPGPQRLDAVFCDAVCAQCHLEGVQRVVRRERGLYDFRPGLRLQDFWRIFVRPSSLQAKHRAVTQVEQMRLSRCYPGRPGTGQMLCVSCHDPHVAIGPDQRVAHYRERCLACHQDRGCSLPRAVRLQRQADDSCIACHMPRFGTTDIIHTAATDHRIPRWPSRADGKLPPHAEEEEELALEPFHSYAAEEEAEVGRDLGLALVRMMQTNEASPERYSARAESLLSDAVGRHAEDVPAWEALGVARLMRHRRSEALAALENALRRDPERENTLIAAATLTWNMQQKEESLAYWRRAIDVNPWLPAYRRSLTQVLLSLGEWEEARAQCRAWMRLEPMNAEAHQVWIELLLREGKKKEAREEFARLEAWKPPNLDSLRDWFNRRMR